LKVGGAGSFLFFDAPARLGECLRISISNLRFYSLLLLRCIFYSHFQRETCSVVFLLLMRGTSSRLGECPVAVRTFTMLVFFMCLQCRVVESSRSKLMLPRTVKRNRKCSKPLSAPGLFDGRIRRGVEGPITSDALAKRPSSTKSAWRAPDSGTTLSHR